MGARIKEHPSVEIFAVRCRSLRKAKGLTCEAVSKAIGINRIALVHYEAGERCPTIPVLYMLAEYFNVSTDFLVGREIEPSKTAWINETMERMGKTAKSMKSLHKAAKTCKQELESIIALTEQEESEENQ